jgi:hypothetical protein
MCACAHVRGGFMKQVRRHLSITARFVIGPKGPGKVASEDTAESHVMMSSYLPLAALMQSFCESESILTDS